MVLSALSPSPITVASSNSLKAVTLEGRQITVTGHMIDLSEVYTADNGEVRLLKRPQIKLGQAVILDGGLGPAPKSDKPQIDRSKTVVVRPSDAVAEKAPADVAPVF